MMISLTLPDGRTLYANPAYIATFVALIDGGSAISFGNDTAAVVVKESPETIIQKISVTK